MWNVLLDPLPEDYKGFRIDSDFRVGVQIFQLLMDDDLENEEKIFAAVALLFMDSDAEGNPVPFRDETGDPLPLPDPKTAVEGIGWFLGDWYTDNRIGEDKKEKRVTDYDKDQWRIYSGFLTQYKINLNTANLHFWEFMGLLTTLDEESAYKSVISIRQKKIKPKMDTEYKKQIRDAQAIYSLEFEKAEYTEEEKKDIDAFDRMMAEQKEIKKRKQEAIETFMQLNGLK